jgi:hypothetical protein
MSLFMAVPMTISVVVAIDITVFGLNFEVNKLEL